MEALRIVRVVRNSNISDQTFTENEMDRFDETLAEVVSTVGARGGRAVIFTVVAFALLWIAPYDLPNSFVIALVVGVLSLINLSARVSLFAIAVLFVIVLVPKEIFVAVAG